MIINIDSKIIKSLEFDPENECLKVVSRIGNWETIVNVQERHIQKLKKLNSVEEREHFLKQLKTKRELEVRRIELLQVMDSTFGTLAGKHKSEIEYDIHRLDKELIKFDWVDEYEC